MDALFFFEDRTGRAGIVQLGSSEHTLAKPLIFDSSTKVSAVRIEGTPGVSVLRASHGGDLLHVGNYGGVVEIDGVSLRGRIRVTGGKLVLIGCTFEPDALGRRLQSTGQGAVETNGGALTVSSGSLYAKDITFKSQQARHDGGAVHVTGGVVEFDDCHFEDNEALEGRGGAIAASSGKLVLRRSLLIANKAARTGGAIHISGDAVVETRYKTHLTDNFASEGGHSIFRDSSASHAVYGLPAPLGTWVPAIADRPGSNESAIVVGATQENYPFPCMQGRVGNSYSRLDQLTPYCAGVSPAGTFTPLGWPAEPIECYVGSFCPEGVGTPISCPGGVSGIKRALHALYCESLPAPSRTTHLSCAMLNFWSFAAGTYSPLGGLANTSQCLTCPLGHSCLANVSWPSKCAKGYFADQQGRSSCQQCSEGKYQERMGQSGCTNCLTNQFCPPGSTMTQCQAGTFGLLNCSRCPKGHYCGAGSALPYKCRVGTYNPYEGQENEEACQLCPSHAVTLQESSAHIEDCICLELFYDIRINLTGLGPDCRDCLTGTDCQHSKGITRYTLPLSVGYYRHSTRSIDVQRCPDATANCSRSVDTECKQSSSACRGGHSECGDGLGGPFCQLCTSFLPSPSMPPVPRELEGTGVEQTNLPDRVVYMYFSAATDTQRATCKPCSDATSFMASLLAGFGGLLGVLSFVCIATVFTQWLQKSKNHVAVRIREIWLPKIMSVLWPFFVDYRVLNKLKLGKQPGSNPHTL